MPRLGETMEEGVIVGWLVEPGQQFRRGDAILELETDKTVVEYPALGDGRLDGTLVSAGDRVPVGAPIARVAVLSAEDWAAALPDTASPDAAEAAAEAAPAAGAPAAPSAPASATAATPAPERRFDDRLRATPTARRLARQQGVALETLHGSGRRGRIERADVELAANTDAPASAADLRWLDTPAGRLAYAQAGSTGPVHLLVHGFAGDRTAWANLASGLARSGKRVVMPDLPGHGATAIEAADVDGLAAAVAALAESLPGPLVLVGHSLGAAAAVHAARRLGDRVSRLVLLTPAGCGPRIGAEFVHGMAAAETTGEVSHLLRLLGPRGGQLSDAALVAMAREMGRGRLRTLATALATADGRQRIDLLRPLAELAERIPVRAVFGLDDRIVSATDALNLPPRVAAHFLPSGHMPQWDAPREVAALIDEETQHG
ncbi:acetoin dehydrogenase dihydrolipoyllysine-residue acetyltransferase subunit [Azospirillum melinis]|uniref:Acetoin dehydrogenase dihydrolipoyllysine-residue acetyltransferase subunit n=2 Tax=Azospirillum melinis TaxID=328839 RepID=A0ABX2K6I0_9PROT|nr:acetoin dehydrogenase dihydrolipoyllysine-residue acetyltransferase subunit [Azospirillum melinis]